MNGFCKAVKFLVKNILHRRSKFISLYIQSSYSKEILQVIFIGVVQVINFVCKNLSIISAANKASSCFGNELGFALKYLIGHVQRHMRSHRIVFVILCKFLFFLSHWIAQSFPDKPDDKFTAALCWAHICLKFTGNLMEIHDRITSFDLSGQTTVISGKTCTSQIFYNMNQ